MGLDDKTADLVGDIYAGIHEPALWESVIQRFRDMLDAQIIFVAQMDARMIEPEQVAIWGLDSSRKIDGQALYQNEYYKLDPGLYHTIENPQGGLFKLSEARAGLSPDETEWRKFLRHSFGSVDHHTWYTAPGEDLGFFLAVHPKADTGLVTDRQAALHALVFQHMARAVRLAARPPDLVAGDKALLLVDRNGRVVQANAAAEAIIAQKDGLSVSRLRLKGANPEETAKIDAALAQALAALETGTYGGAVAVQRFSGRRPYLLTMVPMPQPPEPFAGLRPAAMVRILDPDAELKELDPEQLRLLFGLTKREAELASRFAAHPQPLPELALSAGVTYDTVRDHMRNIRAKCGAASLVELAQLLARLD